MKNVSDFGTLGAGNDAAIMQAAFDYAKANNVSLKCDFFGTLQMAAPVSYVTSSANVFTPGLILVGEGAEKTVWNNNHGGPGIVIATDTPVKFQRHGIIEGFTFKGQGSGICLRSAYQYQLNGLQISDKPEHGIHIQTLLGDADACNNLSLEQVRIDNCAKWGIFCEVVPGVNELSFTTMRNVFIQQCGTKATEVGGGMYWRGQALSMDSVAFAVNRNRGLYIEGGAGLGSDLYGVNVTFENNEGKHIQCYGGKNLVFDNLQMYSNDMYKTTHGVWANASTSVIQNFLVRSGKVRATAGNNPHTAFYGVGGNLVNAKAQNIAWDLFGSAGQTQMTGFTA